jgi:hypothetical protein
MNRFAPIEANRKFGIIFRKYLQILCIKIFFFSILYIVFVFTMLLLPVCIQNIIGWCAYCRGILINSDRGKGKSKHILLYFYFRAIFRGGKSRQKIRVSSLTFGSEWTTTSTVQTRKLHNDLQVQNQACWQDYYSEQEVLTIVTYQ